MTNIVESPCSFNGEGEKMLSVDFLDIAPARVLGAEKDGEFQGVDLDFTGGHHQEFDLVPRIVEPQFVAPGDKVFAASPGESGAGEVEVDHLEGMVVYSGDLQP